MRAVIFDFDGLILDTEWPAYISVAEAFAACGSEMSLERWQRRVGRGDNAPWTDLLVADVGTDIDTETLVRNRQRRNESLIAQNAVLPGVVEVLDHAGELGMATAVASSSDTEWVAGHLTRLDLLARFEAVRTADHVNRTKPWPDVFLAASEAIGVAPERCIVLEDSSHGVSAAKAAGMTCIAVPNRVTAVADFSHADLVVDSLLDVDLAALVAAG